MTYDDPENRIRGTRSLRHLRSGCTTWARTVISHIQAWHAHYETRPRGCRHCDTPITLQQSTQDGHRGFCTYEHATLDQEEQPL